MSLSFDDRLLGEKTQYYCSSSEDEKDDEDEENYGGNASDSEVAKSASRPEIQEYDGSSTNTGPKGVINDWREYKRLENERREEQKREKEALVKKLSATCRSHLDDEREKQNDEQFLQDLQEIEDEFLIEYRKKRIEEMRRALENVPKFGHVVALTKDKFVEAIDKEKPQVTVMVHIYEDDVVACQSMNGCLLCLAQEYPTIKFCKIKASEAKLSLKFAAAGVPAILIYKNGELIGNFIRLSDDLGDDFFATDLESFLQEHSFLPRRDLINNVIRDRQTGEVRGTLPVDEDSGSDFEID